LNFTIDKSISDENSGSNTKYEKQRENAIFIISDPTSSLVMKEFIRGYLRFKVFLLVWIQLPSYASRRQKIQRLGHGRRQFDLISKALFVESAFSNLSIGEHFISDGEPTFTPTTAYPSTDSPVIQFVSPTLTPSNLPMGPFITSATANERIVIPEPKKPVFRERYDCPHLQDSLLDWHAHTTWKNEVPFSGSVTLPQNSRIVIRESIVGLFQRITIPKSSELIFGENKEGITLDAHGIDVRGKLIMGSETCRIQTPVIITLHGDRPSDAVTNVPAPTVKGITVTGEIHIHGQRFFRTWTRLAATVEPGDSIIMLQHEVNWLPGQTILLVTTAMKDSREWHRNELATVDRVLLDSKSDVGAAVFLQSPVSFQHIANSGYQAEVGLLTRSIKVQGNWVSEPSDPDPLNCTSTRMNYGDNAIPCPNKDLTGYGGHILIHKGGKGFVEGLELYRMGQTNVLGRYPIHFHLLGDKCNGCYFRDSSIHRSFYRCVSIHGTDHILIAENVAFDVIGFCYYLEDGVEQYNRIEFNLGAHIHLISPGDPPWSNEQSIGIYKQSENLILPADVAAAAFYITNVHNYIIGNAASGGWAGFAFPNLPYAIGENTKVKIRPSSVLGLTIDGNTAHSAGWWWKDAAAFYFGGSLYYNSDDILEYEPGRDLDNRRSTCMVNKCLQGSCNSFCRSWEQAWMQVNNTKSFLVAGIGLGSWSGRVDVYGYECHDCGLAMKAQSSDGFSARHVLAVCRTYTPLLLPPSAKANELQADGFHWYDTGQEHILTDIIFKNCGYRSSMYSQYNPSPIRGCGDEEDIGCSEKSSVWTMITHSDLYVPEIMQGTKEIQFENCGRRFFQYDFRQSKAPQLSSNSGRLQNWYDMDGSITGLNQPSVLASGLNDTGMWWQVDNEGECVKNIFVYIRIICSQIGAKYNCLTFK
jgi:G8 domain